MKRKKLLSFIQITIFIIAIVLVLLRLFVYSPFTVNGQSMAPTFNDKERLLVNKLSYKITTIKRFDIVAINLKSSNKRLIKRVIGLPGENIEYRSNTLYINGKKIIDPFIAETPNFSLYDTYGLEKIPKGSVLVIGDNRLYSHDSRSKDIGFIPISDIEGEIQIRFSPLAKFTIFN